MCLAIPALIKAIDGYTAEVDIGDYVLLHTGYAINIIDPQEAEETLKLLMELNEAL
jgi:hydrogenase expression/formation protein HypC